MKRQTMKERRDAQAAAVRLIRAGHAVVQSVGGSDPVARRHQHSTLQRLAEALSAFPNVGASS